MDLRQLATFQTVVDAGTFSLAARRLGIGPSTVTLHIQHLESSLGGPVFVRQGRKLSLTELGLAVRSHADVIIRHLSAIAEEASDLASAARGTIRLGSIEPVAHLNLVPLLARLGRNRPHTRLLLDVAGTTSLSSSVAEGRLAFAISSAPPADLGLMFEPLFREPIGLLLPAHSDVVHDGQAIWAKQLADVPVILSEPGCAYHEQVIETFQGLGIALDVRAEIASAAATVEAVRAGIGVALMPTASLVPPPEEAVVRELADVELALGIGIVRPRAAEPHSPLTSQVLAAIRKAAPSWRSPERRDAGAAPIASTTP